jgi:hypothetical protein
MHYINILAQVQTLTSLAIPWRQNLFVLSISLQNELIDKMVILGAPVISKLS